MTDTREISTPEKGALPIFPDMMVFVPRDGRLGDLIIEKVPSWIASWTGYSPDDIEGKPVTEVFDPVSKAFSSMSKDMLKDGIPVEDYYVEFTDVSGNRHIVSINGQRIAGYTSVAGGTGKKVHAGPLYAVLIRVRDISALIERTVDVEGAVKFYGIVGRSEAIRNVFQKIEVYGPAEAPVVITGETGTGKELVARALHEHSNRRNGPFVAVNCSALNEDLFESELFGHERGSFTGAVKSHKGRFERANQGTLFLDEIGDTPARTQVKLLRVLESGAIERVGGEKEFPVDIRLIAATNIPLERAVAEKRFRPDLYHRISVFRIHVPPLRERREDILLLVNHFLGILNRRYNRKITRLTPDAVRLLEQYYWPGNVRELRNVLERIYVETHGTVIGRNAFNEWVRERDYLSAGEWNIERLEDQKALSRTFFPDKNVTIHPQYRRIPNLEKRGIQDNGSLSGERGYVVPRPVDRTGEGEISALDAEYQISSPFLKKRARITPELMKKVFKDAGGNITLASSLLGVHKATFYRSMQKYGLSREDLEDQSKHEHETEEKK